MPHTPDPLLSALSPSDLLFICLYGEVRGEPKAGQIAVGATIRNRVLNPQQTYGKGWEGVILKYAQFSCLWANLGGKDFETTKEAATHTVQVRSLLQSLSTISNGIYDGSILDPTGGATHYVTVDLLNHQPPTWTIGATSCGVFGHHQFFKDVK